MQNKILTIIVTYNGSQWIEKCVQSLLNSTLATDILIIDNASQDDTIDLVKTKFPIAQCIRLKANKGFGAANNVGLKIALTKKYDFVFLVNQDAYVAPTCVEELVKVFRNNAAFAVLSPWQYNYEETGNETYFNDFVLKEYCNKISLDREGNDQSKVFETSFVHAAAWFIPISTVATNGGFDPLFFYTGEDNDYVQRLKAKNMKMAVVPAAVFYHKGSNTAMKNPASNDQLFMNTELLKLKLPNASTTGALALFAKNAMRANIKAGKKSAIALDKMKAIVFKTLAKKIPAILSSRKEQQKKEAYL